MARSSGFEPEFSVLETVVLPIRLQPNLKQIKKVRVNRRDMAGEEGLEPSNAVLETVVFPN